MCKQSNSELCKAASRSSSKASVNVATSSVGRMAATAMATTSLVHTTRRRSSVWSGSHEHDDSRERDESECESETETRERVRQTNREGERRDTIERQSETECERYQPTREHGDSAEGLQSSTKHAWVSGQAAPGLQHSTNHLGRLGAVYL